MGNVTAAYVTVNPSYTMPEIILQYQQASGAFDLLASRDPMPRLGEGDLFAYIKKLDVRTKVAAGQQAYNSLPSASVVASQISTPTYLMRTRAEYDHHDLAAAGRWGFSLVEAQRLAMRQGIFQLMRTALLYGFNAANGEGLLNAAGSTAVNLPADSNGDDTVLTYDNGQMAVFLLAQIGAIKTRANQLGLAARVVILGPQRVLSVFEYQNIVQLTQFQRTGAGSLTTAGVVKEVTAMNEDMVEWVYDDTLIGKGAGGADAVVITIPEVKKPMGTKVNTNEFAELQPGLAACNIMLCDMAAPREIPTPLPGGAIDVLSELRCTSGWGLRPEVITVVSMVYE
jgi:hypothetical protein